MITGILAIVCTGYFIYVYRWAQSYLWREYLFGSPTPPRVLPHSAGFSMFMALVLGGVILKSMQEFSSIFAVAALVSSYCVMYRLGEMRGVAQMKTTVLFTDAMTLPKRPNQAMQRTAGRSDA